MEDDTNAYLKDLFYKYEISIKEIDPQSSRTTKIILDTVDTYFTTPINLMSSIYKTKSIKKLEMQDIEAFNFVNEIEKEIISISKNIVVKKIVEEPKTDVNYFNLIKQLPHVSKLVNKHISEMMGMKKRVAVCCAREMKRGYTKTSRTNPFYKSKRIFREMINYNRRMEKEEKYNKRKIEKMENDKRRREFEGKESMRQAKKLDFLLAQTEIFSDFMRNKEKLKKEDKKEQINEEEKDKIKIKNDETNIKEENNNNESNSTKSNKEIFANLTDKELTEIAERKAMEAAQKEIKNLEKFENNKINNKSTKIKILNAELKDYQKKGLSWLISLYNQGINGILADDMGLGKTVQTIALLSHLAENENIWGPFLIITPVSTLYNWIEEFRKFLPIFKVVSYWGNVVERKALRKKWNMLNVCEESSPLHVVLTSYQIVVADEKIFQKVKWQYMILDEAQAIKSSQSIRWKTLLNLNTRNRLLLTGTPIQNNMQELWALLHFIMPSLFDSHDEFSEWFSKGIEGASGRRNIVNEKQLQRLHSILKPFMLRREKKDVKDELGLKIEKDIYCNLSHRQIMLYEGIKQKTPISELLDKKNFNEIENNEGLMNLVMQLRKVCNHPDIFEKMEIKSGYAFSKNNEDETVLSSFKHKFELNVHKFEEKEIPVFLKLKDNKELSSFVNYGIVKGGVSLIENEFEEEFVIREIINEAINEDEETSDDVIVTKSDRKIEKLINVKEEDDKVVDNVIANEINRKQEIKNKKVKITLENKSNDKSNKKLNHEPLVNSSFENNRITINLNEKINNYSPNKSVICSIIDNCLVKSKDNLIYNISFKLPFLKIPYFYYAPVFVNSILLNNKLPQLFVDKKDSNILLSKLLKNKKLFSIPPLGRFVSDSGKLQVLDTLLPKLKNEGHRVLLYFQMTRMIDLMEEYLVKRTIHI